MGSMVAASAARNGHSVLHVDTNDYYGETWAAFNFDRIQKWIELQQERDNKRKINESLTDSKEVNSFDTEKYQDLFNENETLIEYSYNTIESDISNIRQKWHIIDDVPIEENSPIITLNEHQELKSDNDAEPIDSDLASCSKETIDSKVEDNLVEVHDNIKSTLESTKEGSLSKKHRYSWSKEKIYDCSRNFNLDILPRLLFARGAMVDLLLSSNISRYTEFKSVSRVLTKLPNGSWEHVPSSRADVFATKHVSVVEKRILMKFKNFSVNYESQPEIYENFIGKTYLEFLNHERLTENLIHFVLHSIAMADENTSCLQGLKSTKKFLSSLGRFGNTPFLHTMYGSGELPQAFCRLCAVFGGTYYLGKDINGIILCEDSIKGIITNGQRISCKNFVIGVSNCPSKIKQASNIKFNETILNRKICLLSDSILPHETGKEQLTFASIKVKGSTSPEETDSSKSVHTFVQEAGFGPSVCPKGMYVLHMTSKKDSNIPAFAASDVNSLLTDSETLLWSMGFDIISRQTDVEKDKCISNIHFCNGPYYELDYDSTIEHAEKICKLIYPEDEFLPRAPDPEEIIIGGEPPNSDSKETKEEHDEVVDSSEVVQDEKHNDSESNKSDDIAN